MLRLPTFPNHRLTFPNNLYLYPHKHLVSSESQDM